MPDLKEFTRVINEHHSSLRYFIQGLGVNPAWVDDIAQDAFLVAYRKWEEFESLENPGAWLRSIARNLVMNETAKLNRRQRLLDENLTTLLLEQHPGMRDIAPWVRDSGEGRWTLAEAIDLDVPAPVIALSLMARLRSRSEEAFSDRLLAAMRQQFGGHAVKTES